ncbi:MAG: DUF552 domain-containing protein [Candidatus Lokiarchaeota archaeon]|nr:DUF552 domain-containing protein [Candidatus Lokiarchaeota archaeon]
MFDFIKRKNTNKIEDGVTYIKSISLSSINDVSPVKDEMREGNIVILNLSMLVKRNNSRQNIELKHIIEELTYFSKMNNGEIAQLGKNYLILTPGPEIQFHKN